MGYTIYAGKETVSALKNNPYVIVLDISLPAGDGVLVAARLQSPDFNGSNADHFRPASEKPGLRERAMKLEAVKFLNKPFDATALADAIESALPPGDNWRPQGNAA